MERAALLIGVSRSGELDHLPAVEDCVDAMAEWALSQGMQPGSVIRITDAQDGAVTADGVRRAIKELCDRRSVEQLVVYFAGHGVYQRYGEYWLLSGAPENPQEAINLHGTIELARLSGIPEIVLIADACRTGGSGIAVGNITGSEVFPNREPTGGDESPVSIFFGAELGYAAHQVRAPGQADARYRGVFTEVMVAVLSGQEPSVVERGGPGEDEFAFVRARRSHRARLKRLLGKKLDELQVDASVFQNPVVRPESEESWIARFPWRDGMDESSGGMPGAGDDDDGAYAGEVAAHDSVGDQLRSMRRRELSLEQEGMPGAEDAGEPAGGVVVIAGPAHEDGATRSLVTPPEAAVVLEGAELVEALPSDGAIVRLDQRGAVFDLEGVGAGSVLAVIGDGGGVIVPVVRKCTTRAAFAGGELRDLALGSSSEARSPHERLRGIVAAAARLDELDLDADEIGALAAAGEDGTDPMLAVLAATALAALRRRDLVLDLAAQVHSTLGVQLFDLALLAGALDGTTHEDRAGVIPAVPLLTRHWSILGAHRVVLHPAVAPLQPHLAASLWTRFDADGVERARGAFGGR